MKTGLLAIAVFAGVLNPFLGGLNAALSKTLERPMWAVAATFAMAMSATLAVALVTGQRLPDAASIAQAPWWSWLGGLFAAGFVLSLTLVADKLGASVFTGVTVTIAMIVSVALDHYGAVGFPVHKAGLLRIVGGIVMTGGLGLILNS